MLDALWGSSKAGKTGNAVAKAGEVPPIFFDMAEAMENGGGRGLIGDWARPLPQGRQAAEQETMEMHSCKEAGWSKLVNSEGETVLIAKPAESSGSEKPRLYSIYVLRTSKKHHAPKFLYSKSFDLRKSSREGGEWTLTSLCCEKCEARGSRACGVAPLARFRCHAPSAGSRRGTLSNMDIDLPTALAHGERAETCEKCGAKGATTSWTTEYSSRTSSCAKAFQLDHASSGLHAGPCLQVNVVSDTKASFQCKDPLSLLYAFSAAVLVARQGK